MKLKQVVKTIIKKELLEALRASKWQIAISVAFPMYLQYALIQRYVNLAATAGEQNPEFAEMLKMAPTLSLMYVAPIVIPFLANALLSKSFIQEKVSGALMPILATGVNLGVLWAAKMISVFLYCYVIALIGIGLDILMIKFYFGLNLVFSLDVVTIVFLITPLAALAITGVMSFLYWTVRFANVLASFLPIVVAMACFGYALAKPTGMVLASGVATVTLTAGAVLFACGFAISKLSKRFVLGL